MDNCKKQCTPSSRAYPYIVCQYKKTEPVAPTSSDKRRLKSYCSLPDDMPPCRHELKKEL